MLLTMQIVAILGYVTLIFVLATAYPIMMHGQEYKAKSLLAFLYGLLLMPCIESYRVGIISVVSVGVWVIQRLIRAPPDVNQGVPATHPVDPRSFVTFDE
jgi:uncharacterized membrane protein